jgi:hypothetical protein
VRSDLRLAELTMKAKPAAPAQALTTSAPRAPTPPPYNPATGTTYGRKQTRRGGGGGKKSGAGAASVLWAPSTPRSSPAPTTPPGWQPAYGTFQVYWAGPQVFLRACQPNGRRHSSLVHRGPLGHLHSLRFLGRRRLWLPCLGRSRRRLSCLPLGCPLAGSLIPVGLAGIQTHWHLLSTRCRSCRRHRQTGIWIQVPKLT